MIRIGTMQCLARLQYIRFSLLAVASVSTVGVFAQQHIVDTCRKAANDSDRIACLEAALLDDGLLDDADEPLLSAPTPVEQTRGQESAAVSGIGANQVVARNQTQEEMLASLEEANGLQVVRYDTVPYEKLLVTLSNGQVWRQINGDTQKLRVTLRSNQTVNIVESSLGGYRLRLNEMRRIVRVERLE